jgi:lysophospholipase L1-like esterase
MVRHLTVSVVAMLAVGLLFGSGDREPRAAHAADPVAYTALGDSLGTPYPTGASPFPSVFRGYAASDLATTVSLTNLSIGGWTSAQLLNAIQTDSTFQDAIANATLITFEIGGNDMLQANSSYQNGTCGGVDNQDCLRSTITTFQANWDAILDELEARTEPDVLLRTMDLFDPFIAQEIATGTFTIAQYYLGQLNGHIHATAAARGIPVADVHLAYNGAAGDEDPVQKGYISFDGVHPNALGHTVIADEFRALGYDVSEGPDSDDDGVPDASDNCPLLANPDQTNTDGDTEGDACDADDDGDGVLDGADNCPLASNAGQSDFNANGAGDACDDADGDGCWDANEMSGSPLLGGLRDHLYPWDFFDVTGDRLIDFSDTLDVLWYFGDAAVDGSPGDLRDRAVLDMMQTWRTSEADDGVDFTDVLNTLASFGHSCN